LKVLGGFDSGEFDFKLFFALSLVCRFLCHFLILRLFLLLDYPLEFSLAFDLLAILLGVLDSKFKLCAFLLLIYSSRERLRNQVVGTLV
jgi:hypothetical protein